MQKGLILNEQYKCGTTSGGFSKCRAAIGGSLLKVSDVVRLLLVI